MRRVSAFLRRHLLTMLWALIPLAVVVVLWIFWAPIAPWLRSAQSFDVVAFLQEHLLTVGLLGGCLLVLTLIWLPKWQASRVQDVKDRLTVENAARQTLAQIIGGAVLIAGLFFTWANLNISQESATKNQAIAREGQITDRFTKAIAQLGDEKLAVRIGGIFALDRIAKDSEKDHWPIMEVLTAYVRENARWVPKEVQPSAGNQPPQEESPQVWPDLVEVIQRGLPQAVIQLQPPPTPTADIQAVLTVLGRRTHTYKKGEKQPLNLAKTDLQGANLERAQLQGVNLSSARLQLANLLGAHLEGANFEGAELRLADLRAAQLQGVSFWKARMQGANLWAAGLQGARLWEAHLQRANLSSASLQEAKLAHAQLQEARLWGAYLQGASLWGAQLQGANFEGAQLQGADLTRAQLQGTILKTAQLQGASLWAAQLQGADLQGAQLENAFLRGAHMEGARNLTVEQLSTVKTLYQAYIDPPLLEQLQQQYPHLLEKSQD